MTCTGISYLTACENKATSCTCCLQNGAIYLCATGNRLCKYETVSWNNKTPECRISLKLMTASVLIYCLLSRVNIVILRILIHYMYQKIYTTLKHVGLHAQKRCVDPILIFQNRLVTLLPRCSTLVNSATF
jgi:hypothetical protein